MDSTRLRSLAGLVALSALAGAPAGAPPLAPSAAPAATSAVGPIPGPGEEQPRPNPYADDAAAAATGRQLFVAYNCSGCHGDHAGGGMGPSLRDVVWIYGGKDADVFDSIAQGRANGMPSWGTLLPEQQIWLIATYVKSLRTPREPDPPR